VEHSAKICKTVISSKEHNLNKQLAGFGISTLLNTLCTFWPEQLFSSIGWWVCGGAKWW